MQRDVTSAPGRNGLSATRRELLALAALGMSGVRPALAAAPTGQLTYGVHISLAPTWFDPAETPSLVTPYMLYYALHDAMLKAMPDELMAHSLAESWSATEDGMSYSFVLRDGVTFHNGERVTAEDVKFSFERYRGAAKAPLHDRVASVEITDPRHLTFKLKNPWPDFLTFYSATTGAGWVVPKKYVEKRRRRRLQEGADRRRAVQVRLVQPWRGTGAGGVRGLLAQAGQREAAGAEGDPRRGDTACRVEAGRDRHRLFGPRRTRHGAAGDAGSAAGADGHPVAVLAVLPGTMGSEVALARRARPAGGASGDRSTRRSTRR